VDRAGDCLGPDLRVGVWPSDVTAAELCVAIGGAAGTLSEVAMAAKLGREILWYRPWGLDPSVEGRELGFEAFGDLEALLADLERRLA